MTELNSGGDLLIDVKTLHFTYEGGVKALQDISFQLRRGELLVVMGANGAGKSTLCYLLSSIIPNIFAGERSGRVWVSGVDPWNQKMFEMARSSAVVLQDPDTQMFMPNLFMELAFGPANLGLPREEIGHRISESLELVGLSGMERRSTKALSGGQKQRAALASALTMVSDVLILDEPTSQLDPLGSDQILQSVRRIREERDLGIVMTTHKTEEGVELADHALILDRGRVRALGARDQVLSQVELLEEVGVQPPPAQKLYHLVCRAGFKPNKRPEEEGQIVRVLREAVQAGNLEAAPPEAGQTAPSGSTILKVENLTVEYSGHPPVRALEEVSMSIKAGELVGIIGQNGSGKSSLVKAMVRLLDPAAGRIEFQGEDISSYSIGQMASRIGLVLQNPDYQLFCISALEEVMFGLTNLKIPKEQAREVAQEALKMVGLGDQKDIFPFRMSFGDRRKLAVAAVMAMGPELLIMDEPTTAQDYRGRYLLADLARDLQKDHGRTVIMITHDMDLVATYAERLIVLYQGRILLDGPTEEIFAQTRQLTKSHLRPPSGMLLTRQVLGETPSLLLTVEDLASSLVPSERGNRTHANGL